MDWQCSGCGRHFNYTVACCPFCHYLTTVTTGGTQPASTNTAMGQLLWEVQEMCRNGISINQVQFDIYNKIEKSGLAQQPHS